MSDLDLGLRIIHSQHCNGHDIDADYFAANVKQAFKDAGWSPPVEYDRPSKQRFGKLVDVGEPVTLPLSNRMTGQEWFDRFEKELPGDVKIAVQALDGDYHNLMRSKVLEAAKKASGIQQ